MRATTTSVTLTCDNCGAIETDHELLVGEGWISLDGVPSARRPFELCGWPCVAEYALKCMPAE